MVEIYSPELSVFWAGTLRKNRTDLLTVVHYVDNRFLCSLNIIITYQYEQRSSNGTTERD